MDVAWFAPHGAHYHAGVIHLLALLKLKMGAWGLEHSGLDLYQLGSRWTRPQLFRDTTSSARRTFLACAKILPGSVMMTKSSGHVSPVVRI